MIVAINISTKTQTIKIEPCEKGSVPLEASMYKVANQLNSLTDESASQTRELRKLTTIVDSALRKDFKTKKDKENAP